MAWLAPEGFSMSFRGETIRPGDDGCVDVSKFETSFMEALVGVFPSHGVILVDDAPEGEPAHRGEGEAPPAIPDRFEGMKRQDLFAALKAIGRPGNIAMTNDELRALARAP